MADAKVSALAAATALTGAELVYVAQGGTPKQATVSALSTPVVHPIAVGDWYIDPVPGYGTGNLDQSEQELDVTARLLPPGTYDVVALNVANAGSAGATFRIALYANAGGVPGALIGQSAAIDATTSGVKQVTLTATFTVGAGSGIVWAGVVCQGGASTRPSFTRAFGQVLGSRSAAAPTDFTGVNNPNYYTGGVSAAPPNPWASTSRWESAPRMAYHRSA